MSGSPSFKAVTPPGKCTEGPYWEEEYGSLLYVDIPPGKLHRYFPKTGRQQQLSVTGGTTGQAVSFVLPVKGRPDILLIGHGQNVSALKWTPEDPDNSSKTPVVVLDSVDQGKQTRFNDAKCDPEGRVFAGTMGFETAPGKPEMEQGSIFRLSKDGKAKQLVDKIHLSNGLAFSLDKKVFYYIDTCNYKVEAFDYDNATGDISNRRTVLDYKKIGLEPDLPDGMTIDTEGNLYVANYSGSKIICVDPVQGKVVRTISSPVPNLTSVCFGGPDYTTMYATSSVVGLSPDQLKELPGSGAVFEITGLGAKGFPSVPAVLDSAVIAKIDAA